jgi:adenosylcobyric acid synthase
MIGQTIHDPEGIDGKIGSQPGLGLMNFETTLAPVKQLSRVSGTLFNGAVRVEGYEIHMGVTAGPDLDHPAINLGDRPEGGISEDNQILCTYLHGVFDHHQACDASLQWADLDADASVDYQALRQREIDRVAAMLEAEIDFDKLAKSIGLKNE